MLQVTIQNDITAALKGGKQTELKVLRFVMSEIKYAEINKKQNLTDEEVIALLQKEMKKRQEAIEMFRKANRTDIISDEEAQIAVIQKYLPKGLSEQELSKIIDEIVEQNKSNPQMGKIIGAVMSQVKGRADGAKVAAIVKNKLAAQ